MECYVRDTGTFQKTENNASFVAEWSSTYLPGFFFFFFFFFSFFFFCFVFFGFFFLDKSFNFLCNETFYFHATYLIIIYLVK